MSIKILRRHTGAAGAPASLQSGQLAINDVDGNLYVGIGDNGSGVATSIVCIAGAAFLLANKVNAANGVAPLDANKYIPMANLPPSILGAMSYQGTWDPTTNTPQLLSSTGTKGYIYKVSKVAAPINTTASAAAGSTSTSISVASATGITVGMLVSGGATFNAGTTVASISGTTVTLSQATTSALSNGQALTFSPYLDGVTQFNVGDQVVFDGAVWDKIDGLSSEVLSVAGRTGAVVITLADIAGAAGLASPAFTGTPTAPTAAAGDNSTKLSTTAFVAAAISAALMAYAPLASPTFTGTPAAPTAAAGTNTTQLATTAFVASALSSGTSTNVDDGTF